MIPPAPILFLTVLSPLRGEGLTTAQVGSHISAAELRILFLKVNRSGKWIYINQWGHFWWIPSAIQTQCSSVDFHFRKCFIPLLSWEDTNGGRATSTPTSQSPFTSNFNYLLILSHYLKASTSTFFFFFFLVEIKLISYSRGADNHSLHGQFIPSFKWTTACTKKRL